MDAFTDAKERARSISTRLVDTMFAAETANGVLSPEAVAAAMCADSDVENGYVDFARTELNAIKQAVMPEALVHSSKNASFHDVFGTRVVEGLSLYYAQHLKEYALRALDPQSLTSDEATRARVVHYGGIAEAHYDMVNLLESVLRATAASIVLRSINTRYASARNTMRTVFSMCKAIVFRDCPRGVELQLSVTDPAHPSEDASVLVKDPPFTRTSALGSDTDVDAVMIARNSWLAGAWSLYLSMVHGIEKQTDLPIDERPQHMNEKEWQQLRYRRVKPETVARISAHLVRDVHAFAKVKAIAAVADRSPSSLGGIRSNMSDAGAMHLALMSYYAYRAVRAVERADRLFVPSKINEQWPMPDFELLLWKWAPWSGGFDRPRVTEHDAFSTKPTAAVYRADARHTHQLRNTRSTIVKLPERYWRPHDAQDTAAAASEDSALAAATHATSYAVGLTTAIAADPSIQNRRVDAANASIGAATAQLARMIRKSVESLRKLVVSGTAPTYHQRAMVEASMSEWPGDTIWTLASPNRPDNSAYARLFAGADGVVGVEDNVKRERQFATCRRIDALQADILVAKKVLRAAAAATDTRYEEASTEYGQEVLELSSDRTARDFEALTAAEEDSPPPTPVASPSPERRPVTPVDEDVVAVAGVAGKPPEPSPEGPPAAASSAALPSEPVRAETVARELFPPPPPPASRENVDTDEEQ